MIGVIRVIQAQREEALDWPESAAEAGWRPGPEKKSPLSAKI